MCAIVITRVARTPRGAHNGPVARPPKQIPPRAAAAWAGGDERGASAVSGLQPRQLRNRLGPPGHGAGRAAPSTLAVRSPSASPLEAAPLTGERLTRAEQVRALVASGAADEKLVGRLVLTWTCSTAEAQRAVDDAAELARAAVLPPDLARSESDGLATRARRRSEDAGDWKGALAAQRHLDQLRGLDGQRMPRAAVVALLRRAAHALTPWPDALAAFRASVEAGA